MEEPVCGINIGAWHDRLTGSQKWDSTSEERVLLSSQKPGVRRSHRREQATKVQSSTSVENNSGDGHKDVCCRTVRGYI